MKNQNDLDVLQDTPPPQEVSETEQDSSAPETVDTVTSDTAASVTETADATDAISVGTVIDPSEKPKKKKKRLTKKKKIVLGVISGIVGAILIAVIVLLSWFFTRPMQKVAFNQIQLEVDMANSYYIGTEGSVDSALTAGKTVTTIDGAYNVSTYVEFYQKLSEGKDVVVHAKDLVMTAELGTIKLKSSIYGNGLSLNAYDVVNGTLDKGGNTAIEVGTDKKVIVRDIKVFGKTMDTADNLKTFNNYGPLLNVTGTVDKKAEVDVIHCIFENGHKVVHLQSANVYMEGTIVRNAADTAISIATAANQATTFTSKNNVVADSLTGGILSYCWDSAINASTDNDKTWNTINILGFLDIYNWKKTSDLAFIPDTEGALVAAAINPFLAEEIALPQYADLLVKDGAEKFIHFGIIKIATNSYGVNKTKVLYDGKELNESNDNALQYKLLTFPIPPFGKLVLKYIEVAGYFNHNSGAVQANVNLVNVELLYKELREGRS